MFHETEDTHYKAFQYMQMNSLYVRRTQKSAIRFERKNEVMKYFQKKVSMCNRYNSEELNIMSKLSKGIEMNLIRLGKTLQGV